jgi:hypothetical protein
MAQRTKTVEYVWQTGTDLRTTVTALAGTNFYTPAAITAHLSETDATRTIRSAELIVTARDAETTTARRFDGVRIGIQVDAVAWSDLDLTGTGITGTGDPYTVTYVRDVTAYLVTNFTGANHSIGARAEFETDVASNVNNITMRLRITYEYNDTSALFTKTVRIPLEGITGFLTTTANANLRGSAAAGQIPALDTFLPEANKTYRQIWFEIQAADGGAATTDFNASFSIDGATARAGATLEQVLNGSSVYYDIWIPGGGDGTGYFTLNAAHDFQAWSSLASRFERMSVVLCVTYTYDRPVSGSVLNSLILPLRATNLERVPGTVTGDKERFEVELWVEEPATITLRQSALFLTYFSSGAGNLDVRVNAQGSTSSLYTTTALLHAGHHSLQHRIDLAHGGSAITLARGRNVFTVDVFSSVTGNTGPSALSGYFIINYESGIASGGEGAHNHTTFWKVWSTLEGTIAGDTYRAVPTTNQRTPNIPEASYWLAGVGLDIKANYTGVTTGGLIQLLCEALSGEHDDDGWIGFGKVVPSDGEFGTHWAMFTSNSGDAWNRYPGDPKALLNPETARVWRFNAAAVTQWAMTLCLTYHAITYAIAGTISASAGGTVDIAAHRADTNQRIGSTSRVGNGSYSITWYDNTINVYAHAWEDGTHLGRSANGLAGT